MPLTPEELKGLKKKLRHLPWNAEAVVGQVDLIRKLRLFLSRDGE